MSPIVICGITPTDLHSRSAEFAATIRETGVLILRGLLKDDDLFKAYVGDLHASIDILGAECGLDLNHGMQIDEKLTYLAAVAPQLGRYLADLGTQPAKLVSANVFKFRSEFVAIAKGVLGSDAILATPSAGDTLHLFPPLAAFHRYNLPVHQDYQYLMQSPSQVTFWCNLGSSREGVGGCSFWVGSHKSGVTKTFKNENGHFQCAVDEASLSAFERVDVGAGEGDLVITDSLTWHRSIQNQTTDQSRVCQIFRYSNLRDARSKSYHWTSTSYQRPSVAFEEIYPELFVSAEARSSN